MVPVLLDPALVRLGLAGRGELAVRRLRWLRGLGVEPLVWSDAPSRELSAQAGPALVRALPQPQELESLAALWVADLDGSALETVVERATAARVLLNVEDVRELCGFHTPSVVRRGRLVLAAGTGGASPATARLVRQRLETAFGPDWAAALEAAADLRGQMKADGAANPQINTATEALLRARGLL